MEPAAETMTAMTFDVADRATWPELMTLDEAAQVLRVHKTTVRQIAGRGTIQLIRLSPQEHRITKDSLLRLLEAPPPPCQE